MDRGIKTEIKYCAFIIVKWDQRLYGFYNYLAGFWWERKPMKTNDTSHELDLRLLEIYISNNLRLNIIHWDQQEYKISKNSVK